MSTPTCIKCHEDFNPRRLELGYRTCLDCGGKAAMTWRKHAKQSVPHHAYNKGAYQYVGTVQAARGVGR